VQLIKAAPGLANNIIRMGYPSFEIAVINRLSVHHRNRRCRRGDRFRHFGLGLFIAWPAVIASNGGGDVVNILTFLSFVSAPVFAAWRVQGSFLGYGDVAAACACS
jgi:hypothetical protein